MGSVTTNYLPKAESTTTITSLVDSQIFDSGTNVGIGTTNPVTKLHIQSSGTTYNDPDNNTVAAAYIYNSTSNSTTAHSILTLRTNNTGGGNPFISFDINQVTGYAMGVDNADGDKFKLNWGWSSLNSATRLTLAGSSGNIGIGTATPNAKLHVMETGLFTNAGTDGGKSYVPETPILTVTTDGNGTVSPTYATNAVFKVGIGGASTGNVTTEYFRVNLNGNVGIGTTNPVDRLQVWAAGSATNTPQIVQRIFATTSGTPTAGFGAVIAAYTQNSSATTTPQTRVEFGAIAESLTAGSEKTAFVIRTPSAAGSGTVTERVRVQQNGNIGIGTTSPNSTLQIGTKTTSPFSDVSTLFSVGAANTGGTVVAATFCNTATGTNNNEAQITFTLGNDYSAVGGIGSQIENATTAASRLKFYTYTGGGFTEKMTILGSGNVGIGTTSPSIKLHTYGTNNTAFSNTTFWNFDFVGQDITNASNTVNTISGLAFTGGSARTSISAIGNILESTTAGALGFFTGGSSINSGTVPERMRITSAGNVGIGTTSISYKLHVNGTMYSAGSSLEYKQDIIHYDVVTDKLLQLQPVTYNYKPEYEHLGKKLQSDNQIGLIAEQVAEIFPELAVMKEEDGQWVVRNVDYEKLSILLLSEVQKLRKEVNQLKTL